MRRGLLILTILAGFHPGVALANFDSATAGHTCPATGFAGPAGAPTSVCSAAASADATSGGFAVEATLSSLADGQTPGAGSVGSSVSFERTMTLPASAEPIDVVVKIHLDELSLTGRPAAHGSFEGVIEVVAVVDPQFECGCFLAQHTVEVAGGDGPNAGSEVELRPRVQTVGGAPMEGGPATLRVGTSAFLQNGSLPGGGTITASVQGSVGAVAIEPPAPPPAPPSEWFDAGCVGLSHALPEQVRDHAQTMDCTHSGHTTAAGALSADLRLETPVNGTAPGFGSLQYITGFRRTITIPENTSYLAVEARIRLDEATMTRTYPQARTAPYGWLVMSIIPDVPCNKCSVFQDTSWTLIRNEGSMGPEVIVRRHQMYTEDGSAIPAGDYPVRVHLSGTLGAEPGAGIISLSYAGAFEGLTVWS